MASEGPERLYRDLLDAWNRRDAAGMAALFTSSGSIVGFDGSQISGGPAAITEHLAPIFSSHKTPAYVATVREVHDLAPGAASLVRAVAGMVPDGRHDLNPALNTIHSVVAVKDGATWRAALMQSTPAAFHGRPDLGQALTAELRALLPQAPAAPPGPGITMTGVGNTARWVAASRAIETDLAVPLFSDPFARELAGEEGFKLQYSMRVAMGGPPDGPDVYISVRTKYLDDALIAAVRAHALKQVVILAAGMDSRAFRLPWPADVRVYEVDREEIFQHKEAVLSRLGASPSSDRHVVRADLARPWTAALLAAGFDPKKPAAFLIEGLLMYLEESEVAQLFAAIRPVAAKGSWMAGDMVSASLLTSPYVSRYLAALSEWGSPWKFGADEPEAFLAAHGWNATVVMPGEPEAHYGRWPFPSVPRAVPGMPRTFLVSATRRDA